MAILPSLLSRTVTLLATGPGPDLFRFEVFGAVVSAG